MLNQPSSSNTDKAKQMAKDLASQAKAKFNKYKDSGNMAADADKMKNKAKDFSKTEGGKTLGAGVLAGIAAVTAMHGGNLLELQSKANMHNSIDKSIKAELVQYEQKADQTKKDAYNAANSAPMFQKSVANTIVDAQKNAIPERIRNMQGSSEFQAKMDSDAKDVTTENNIVGNVIRQSSDSYNREAMGEDFGPKLAEAKSKLQDYDQAKGNLERQKSSYESGSSVRRAERANENLNNAMGDAAKTFVVGGAAAGFAFSKRNKGEKPKTGPDTEPNPSPEPIPDAQETINVAEAAIESKETVAEMSQDQRTEIKEVKEKFDAKTNEEEAMKNNLTGFTAQEYGPKEAPIVEAPAPAVAEVKKEEKKGGFFGGIGKLASRFGLIGLASVGGGKAIEQVYGMATADSGAKIEMTQPASTGIVEAPQATTESKIDIASEGSPDEENTPETPTITPQATTEAPSATPAAETIPVTPAATTEAAPEVKQEIPAISPLAYSADTPDYLATKAKVEAFAKESGVGNQMRAYTTELAGEMVTNMTATLNEKGATMAPDAKAVLEAKINSWKYIQSHIKQDSIYIEIADSAKGTFEKATTGNPNSVLLKIRMNRLNITDIANHKFESGTFAGSYADSHGLANAKSDMENIRLIRDGQTPNVSNEVGDGGL
jgi:hypothetical protein